MLSTTESLAFQGGDGRESLLRHRMEIYKLGLKYKCTVPRGLLPPRQAGPPLAEESDAPSMGIRLKDEECASERRSDKPLGGGLEPSRDAGRGSLAPVCNPCFTPLGS